MTPPETSGSFPRSTLALVTVFVASLAISEFAGFELGAQSSAADPPRFEVVSIKPNSETFEEHFLKGTQNGQSAFSGFKTLPGGRLQGSFAPIRPLIMRAFEIKSLQLVGGPGWLDDDKFDIDARAGHEATAEELNAMLRTLLAERFKLRTHVEMRPVPVYAVTVARGDGRLGPAMRASSEECVTTLAKQRTEGASRPSPPSPREAEPAPICGLNWVGGGASGGRRISFGGTTVAALLNYLMLEFDGPVEDRTGLAGNFDVVLEYESTAMQRLGRAAVGEPSGAPTLRDALQNQLGLKVEKTTGTLPFTIIDAIERPTPD